MQQDWEKRRRFLLKLGERLGPFVHQAYDRNPGARGRDFGLKTKSSPSDLVTEWDIKTQAQIVEWLQESFPGEPILGEESPSKADWSQSSGFWVVDPIDGTTNFSKSYPFFSISIAFAEVNAGKAISRAGLVYDVGRSEAYTAGHGFGAFIGRQKLRLSGQPKPQESLLTTGFIRTRNGEIQNKAFRLFEELTRETLGVRRDGSAALDLACVASGRIEGYWEEGLSPWDTAAGALLVQEAGGLVTDFSGSSFNFFKGELIAAHPALHKWLMDRIKKGDS
jgi:myo-inositol-1(or 4)-monophosphatase